MNGYETLCRLPQSWIHVAAAPRLQVNETFSHRHPCLITLISTTLQVHYLSQRAISSKHFGLGLELFPLSCVTSLLRNM